MIERIKNIKHKQLSDKFFKLYEINFDYRLKNGDWINNNLEVLERGNAVAALLFNKEEQKIILVKQFRMPAFLNGHDTGFLLEVPAGMIDKKDESPAIAMQREILEETGYNIPKLEKIYEVYATPGGSTERFSCFVGAYNDSMKENKGGGLDDENEDIEIIEISFNKALNYIENGQIMDAKTIMLIQFAQINSLLG